MPITTREAQASDAPAIARVHVDCWRSTYRGILPDALLDRLRYGEREAQWLQAIDRREDDTSVIIGEEGNGLIGFASCGRERTGHPDFHGELYAIYVRAENQRRGCGRLLFDAATARLRQQDFTSMLLWVLEKNPARRFYEALGGTIVGDKREDFDGVSLLEVAYGWKFQRL